MIVHTSKQEILISVAAVNDLCNNNVEVRDLVYVGLDKQGNEKHRLRLTVMNSKGKFARRGIPQRDWLTGEITKEGRRLKALCWHGHGEFFNALPRGTKIETGSMIIYAGDVWVDWRIGSKMYPCYISDACDCES